MLTTLHDHDQSLNLFVICCNKFQCFENLFMELTKWSGKSQSNLISKYEAKKKKKPCKNSPSSTWVMCCKNGSVWLINNPTIIGRFLPDLGFLSFHWLTPNFT